LAILLAIAIPTFLGVTGSANDRAAQSNLNTMLTNAKSIYEQSNQAYPAAGIAATIHSNEPSLNMNTTATPVLTAGQAAVVTSTDGNGAVVFALANNTNECWWAADNPAAVTAANGPWTTTGAVGIPSPGVGVPMVQGVFYGVFKATITAGVSNCSVAGLAGATSNIATPGFPAAQ
jgi:type II secretory pathway pseudopilin PulG